MTKVTVQLGDTVMSVYRRVYRKDLPSYHAIAYCIKLAEANGVKNYLEIWRPGQVVDIPTI